MRGPHPLYPAAAQRRLPVLRQSSHDGARARVWRVIHACEYARDVLTVVETQIIVGMRPYIVTPHGAGSAELYLSGRQQDQPRSLSLLRSWQDVRNWRKSILECDPENSAELVHAHSFAAGMAAVRSTGGVVYDLSACIEELAIAAGQCEPGSWMGRSFRVAEQFVLTRAGAVVVHSSAMRDAARERGALAENTFVIPEPMPADEQPALARWSDGSRLKTEFAFPDDAVLFYVPQFAVTADAGLQPHQRVVLEGFARARKENANFRLLLEAETTSPAQSAVRECVSQLGIVEDVAVLNSVEAAIAWESADLIIALDHASDLVMSRRVNHDCLTAMLRSKPLLAADSTPNRDASPDGRGCLWFERHSAADLAIRIAFLGRNPGFRRALGAAGRMYLTETRSVAAIGKKYQEAYRHAFNRRKATGPGAGMATLEPAANWG
jgi:glycosyltransferase involved in cell wall biosynthesis